MEQFAAWLTLGLLAGLLARLIVPGAKNGGWISAIILGMVGAFVGGWIARYIGILPDSRPGEWLPSLHSIGSATVGAIIVLSIWRWIMK